MAIKLVVGAVCGSAAICLGLLNPQVLAALASPTVSAAHLTPHLASIDTATWAVDPTVVSAADIRQALSTTHR
ncbi:MAG: hypothetical protein RJA98_2329 [Pseudomonadota bacterium]|jgi:hypothetical protein